MITLSIRKDRETAWIESETIENETKALERFAEVQAQVFHSELWAARLRDREGKILREVRFDTSINTWSPPHP